MNQHRQLRQPDGRKRRRPHSKEKSGIWALLEFVLGLVELISSL